MKVKPDRQPTKFCSACGAQIEACAEICPDCRAPQPSRLEAHKNYRDQQFWFTAAAVGFNAVIIDKFSDSYSHWAATAVSAVAVHLIVTRWMAGAGRAPENPPELPEAWFGERLLYTIREIIKGLFSIPYIIAECSSTLFYIGLVVLTCVGVWIQR